MVEKCLSDFCLHESQYQSYNSDAKIQTCDNCGEITN